MGRMGRPQEIAAAALFLGGPGSSYMLGAEIGVDGGRAEL
jgi:NAD(P)-dependent dehydrogenase (short-subunit alcohol dehydrogenase family)